MERMDKSLESVRRNFASVRTGRANPAMLDRIEVGAGRRRSSLPAMPLAAGAVRCTCASLCCCRADWCHAHQLRKAAAVPCPNPAALQFDYYGAQTPLRTVANISTPESTLLVVQVGAAALDSSREPCCL